MDYFDSVSRFQLCVNSSCCKDLDKVLSLRVHSQPGAKFTLRLASTTRRRPSCNSNNIIKTTTSDRTCLQTSRCRTEATTTSAATTTATTTTTTDHTRCPTCNQLDASSLGSGARCSRRELSFGFGFWIWGLGFGLWVLGWSPAHSERAASSEQRATRLPRGQAAALTPYFGWLTD